MNDGRTWLLTLLAAAIAATVVLALPFSTPAAPADSELPTERPTAPLVSVAKVSTADVAAENPSSPPSDPSTSPSTKPTADKPATETGQESPAPECNARDVVAELARSAMLGSIELAIYAKQLNPRCQALPRDFATRATEVFERHYEATRKIANDLGTVRALELLDLIGKGKLPEMTEQLSPRLYARARSAALREFGPGVDESSTNFRTNLYSQFGNLLTREEGYDTWGFHHRSDAAYIARTSDLPAYSALLSDGPYQLASTAACMEVLDLYSSHGFLDSSERSALWARFTSLVTQANPAATKSRRG